MQSSHANNPILRLARSLGRFKLDTFLHSVAKVVGGNAVVSLIGLVASIFVARWTPPYQLGLWNLVLLVTIYVPVIQLGVFNGLNRQLPYFIGRGERAEALRMAEVAFAWCLVLMTLSALLTVPVVIHFWFNGDHLRAWTALAVGLIVTLSWPTQFYTVTYRTSAEFGRLAARNTIVAVVGAPLTLLVMAFGYLGLIIRAVFLAALAVVALYYKQPMRVKAVWERGVLLQLGKVGMPIWVLGQLGVFFLTLDRIMLADSPLSLGYYVIAVQASTFAGMVPTAITMVMYPQMVQKYGESHNALEIWNIAGRGAAAAVGLGFVSALCGWLLVPYFIAYLVPAYQPGTRAAQWACLTGVVMGFSVYNNVFNVIQRQDIYLISWVTGLAVFFSSWYVLIHFVGQVDTVAAVQAMLLAILIMSLAAMLLSRIVSLQHDRRRAVAIAAGVAT